MCKQTTVFIARMLLFLGEIKFVTGIRTLNVWCSCKLTTEPTPITTNWLLSESEKRFIWKTKAQWWILFLYCVEKFGTEAELKLNSLPSVSPEHRLYCWAPLFFKSYFIIIRFNLTSPKHQYVLIPAWASHTDTWKLDLEAFWLLVLITQRHI